MNTKKEIRYKHNKFLDFVEDFQSAFFGFFLGSYFVFFINGLYLYGATGIIFSILLIVNKFYQIRLKYFKKKEVNTK